MGVDALGNPVSFIDSPYPGTPEHAGSIALNYRLPFIDESLGKITLSGSYYRQASVVLNDEAILDPFDEGIEDGWGKLDLRADWANIAGSSFDGALFVSNATDDVHAVALNSYYAFVGTASAVYSEPRLWGAQVRYRFGAQ